jgi:TonB-linked SusC/RagA family outer membrane protein
VSILKDASSTAVFGVRGANGVILVTTRQGDSAKPQLSVTGEFSLQSLAARFDRIHSWEYAELRNESGRNDGIAEANLPYTPYMIQKYKDGSDPVFFPDRDIYHDYFHDFAPQTRFNLNYSGTTDKLRYFFNAGYINQQGLVKTESPKDLGYDPAFKMNRYSFRSNLEYNIFDNLKVTANVASYMEQLNTSGRFSGTSLDDHQRDLMASMWTMPPVWPGPVTVAGYTASDGSDIPENQPVNIDAERNVYGFLNRSGYLTRNTTNFYSSVGIEWGLDFITPGLSTKVLFSYDGFYYAQLLGNRAFPSYGFYQARSESEVSTYTVLRGIEQVNEAISLSKEGGSRFYVNFQYSLNYTRQFGKHNVTGLFMLQRDNWENYDADLPFNIFGMSGRLTYNYDQRYMAEFNAGYNGSEQFAKGSRFGFFPAFSAGWVVSNESLLKDNNILTHLKLRASYGKVGNDKLGDARFVYRTTMMEEDGYYSQLNSKRVILQRLGNEKVSWETAEKQNYGFDIQLFREFSFSLDLFFEERNNVFITSGMIPEFIGFRSWELPRLNIGRIQNRGYEAEAMYQKNLNNGLSFSIKGNFAYNRNKMLYMDEALLPDDYAVRYRSTGYSVGQFFGYKIDKSNGNGYLNTQEELDWAKGAYSIGTPRLGYIKYSDENGDGIIDVKDHIPIRYHPVPRITYGFSGSVACMGFDFSFLFTGITQSSTYMDRGIRENEVEGFYNDIHRRAWTEERYLNGEKITFPALSLMINTNHEMNEFSRIQDRSFLKLKNVELGYNLPAKWLQTMSISRIRVYTNANNLLTWSKMPLKTIDPEQSTLMAVPNMKMVNFGLNVVF